MTDNRAAQRWVWHDPPARRGMGAACLLAAVLLHGLAATLLLPTSPVPLPPMREIPVELVQTPPEPPAKPPAPAKPQAAPKPPEAKPQEAAARPAPEKPAAPPPPPTQQAVVRFGDRDRGARKAAEGSGAEDGSAGAAREPAPVQPAEAASAPATPQPPDQGTPDTSAPAQPAEATPASAPKLQAARKLYSAQATGDLTAMTATGTLSRAERAGQLCVTELGQQLRHGAPPYQPDMLPRHPLKQGNVLELTGEAFYAGGQWYDLRYRCEVDAEATRVTGFAHAVGAPIPRGELKRRGLPD